MRRSSETQGTVIGESELRRQEYEALAKGAADKPENKDFVCVPGVLGEIGSQWFDRIMLAKRLREVRALEYFTRLQPPGTTVAAEHRAPIYSEHTDWLPAIEVTGEGVFLSVAGDRLTSWEGQPEVQSRIAEINKRYAAKFDGTGSSPDRIISPRLVLVHTLAHILINQWSLDSGYPAASLRERLFVGEDMAALLIYTATTDSAGSLGGVVGMAEPARLDAALTEAAANAEWCSSDPVCIEAIATGVDSLNLASCHACLLLPEVSCEERNVLLDRATLIGTDNNSRIGFLSGFSE
jgi:hypothetical protein